MFASSLVGFSELNYRSAIYLQALLSFVGCVSQQLFISTGRNQAAATRRAASRSVATRRRARLSALPSGCWTSHLPGEASEQSESVRASERRGRSADCTRCTSATRTPLRRNVVMYYTRGVVAYSFACAWRDVRVPAAPSQAERADGPAAPSHLQHHGRCGGARSAPQTAERCRSIPVPRDACTRYLFAQVQHKTQVVKLFVLISNAVHPRWPAGYTTDQLAWSRSHPRVINCLI